MLGKAFPALDIPTRLDWESPGRRDMAAGREACRHLYTRGTPFRRPASAGYRHARKRQPPAAGRHVRTAEWRGWQIYPNTRKADLEATMARTKGAKGHTFWKEAVRQAALREDVDDEGVIRKRLNIVADKLLRLAMDGDVAAMKEIGDRLDGKAVAQIEGPGENGEFVHQIVRSVVKADNPDG